MICLRLPVFALLPALLLSVQLVHPRNSHAIEARFELDPSQVTKSAGSPVQREKASRRSGYHRANRSHKNSVVLHKDPADQNQSSASMPLASGSGTAVMPDLQQVRSFWETLNPPKGEPLQPLAFKSDSFELAVDPARYPLFKAVDGGKVLLDTGGTLPPLVRSLIQEKDPSVRIVTASSAGSQPFLRALLSAGGFYSVEEQPVMTFGTDPLLKVRSDFKVERTAESVIRNDVMLVSASRQGLPSRLTDYLKTQGFKLLEPFAERVAAPLPLRHQVIHVAPRDQIHTVDQVLAALSVSAERNRRVQLFSAVESGIALSVAAERYFERAGKRYVLASFTGDAVTYTLFRLLETKGYRVVILEPQDTFKSIATKLLTRMELPSSYASHLLVSDPAGRYSLQMSGFLLENSLSNGGTVMLTDRPLEQNVRELLYDHGYQVQERQVGP
jgi:hypothetical protein